MEYLAWYDDGPITSRRMCSSPMPRRMASPSRSSLARPTTRRCAGARRRAGRRGRELHGKGRDAFILRTYVDRGYLASTSPRLMGPVSASARLMLSRCRRDGRGARLAGGQDRRRPARMRAAVGRCSWTGSSTGWPSAMVHCACTRCSARISCVWRPSAQWPCCTRWAVVRPRRVPTGPGSRKYKRVLIVTPASVVPGIIEDLTKASVSTCRLSTTLKCHA